MNRKDKKNVDILFQNSLFEAISIKSHFNLSNNFSKIKISSLTAPNFSKHMQKRDKNNLSDEQQLHDNNSAADLHSRHDRVISFEEPASSLFPFGQQKNWNICFWSFLSAARRMIIALFAGRDEAETRKRFDVFDPRRNVAKRGLECRANDVMLWYHFSVNCWVARFLYRVGTF